LYLIASTSLLSFYFPGVLIGPATRFVDYRAWAQGTVYASVKGKEKDKGISSLQQPPPGRIQAAARELVIGLFFLGVYTVFAPGWDFSALILPVEEGGLGKKETTLVYRVWFATVASFMARTKYYGVWTLTNVSSGALLSSVCSELIPQPTRSQASCILSGLSYNGVAPVSGSSSTELSSRTRWDRCQNVDIFGVEFAQNWKELLDHWNMNTSESRDKEERTAGLHTAADQSYSLLHLQTSGFETTSTSE
jgi:lysophospholipid acyltransferase